MKGFLSLYSILSISMMSGIMLFIIFSFSQLNAWQRENSAESRVLAAAARIQNINEIRRIAGIRTSLEIDHDLDLSIKNNSIVIGNYSFECRECSLALAEGRVFS